MKILCCDMDDAQMIDTILKEIEELNYIPEDWEQNGEWLEDFGCRFEPERSRMMNAIKERKIALDTQKIALDTQKTNNDSQTPLERIEDKIDLILKKLGK